MNNNNYRIIRTIYENLYQRVLECSDNNTNEVFYNNIITNEKIIKLIYIQELENVSTNILECNKTDDRMYIITKPLENKYKNIKEYIRNNALTLKQQFVLAENIIELSSDIYDMTDIVQQKILDLDKLYIDDDGKVIVNCDLVFEQEYDISDNETLKRMGNIIHFIFSKAEVVDYNISEIIPPDILKIIVRSLTKEYMHPKDALKELFNSPIYKMIMEKANKKGLIAENENKSGEIEKEKVNAVETQENEDDVYDIYLKDNVERPKKKVKNTLSRHIVPLVMAVLVLLVGSKLMSLFGEDSSQVSNNGKDITNNNSKNDEQDNKEDNENEGDNSSGTDSTNKYFNKELIEKISYTGDVAEIDDEIYVEGDKSLVTKNESEDKIKALFATIDFTDPNYSYLLKQQMGVSAKIRSENNTSVLIVLEAYKDGKVASSFHKKMDITNDMWAQKEVLINVANADYLNVYIEYSGANKIWVDSLYIDVVK